MKAVDIFNSEIKNTFKLPFVNSNKWDFSTGKIVDDIIYLKDKTIKIRDLKLPFSEGTEIEPILITERIVIFNYGNICIFLNPLDNKIKQHYYCSFAIPLGNHVLFMSSKKSEMILSDPEIERECHLVMWNSRILYRKLITELSFQDYLRGPFIFKNGNIYISKLLYFLIAQKNSEYELPDIEKLLTLNPKILKPKYTDKMVNVNFNDVQIKINRGLLESLGSTLINTQLENGSEIYLNLQLQQFISVLRNEIKNLEIVDYLLIEKDKTLIYYLLINLKLFI